MTGTAKIVFEHYGMIKLMEELGECQTEVAKAVLIHMEDGRFDSVQLRKLASEIADVEFLFDQIRTISRMSEWIDRERTYKENRQLNRIKEE